MKGFTMKYDSLSRNTVKITLSEADMEEYSLRAESIALRTPEIKRTLAELLGKMRLFPEYRPDRLFLEAFPKKEGGCVLYVSTLGGEIQENEEAPLLCRTENLSVTVQLCFGLKNIMKNPAASVYRYKNGYAVTVTPSAEDCGRIRSFLSEYGEVSRSNAEICSLSEYGVPVCEGDACEVLSRLY